MRNIVEQGVFEGYPIFKAHLTWTAPINEPRFRGRRFGKEYPLELDIAIAHEYPSVKRVLLFAPSGNAGEAVQNLRFFKGEVYIVVGENDEVVKPEAGPLFYKLA